MPGIDTGPDSTVPIESLLTPRNWVEDKCRHWVANLGRVNIGYSWTLGRVNYPMGLALWMGIISPRLNTGPNKSGEFWRMKQFPSYSIHSRIKFKNIYRYWKYPDQNKFLNITISGMRSQISNHEKKKENIIHMKR